MQIRSRHGGGPAAIGGNHCVIGLAIQRKADATARRNGAAEGQIGGGFSLINRAIGSNRVNGQHRYAGINSQRLADAGAVTRFITHRHSNRIAALRKCLQPVCGYRHAPFTIRVYSGRIAGTAQGHADGLAWQHCAGQRLRCAGFIGIEYAVSEWRVDLRVCQRRGRHQQRQAVLHITRRDGNGGRALRQRRQIGSRYGQGPRTGFIGCGGVDGAASHQRYADRAVSRQVR